MPRQQKPHSASVYIASAASLETTLEHDMALYEQLWRMIGPTKLARLLAERLRDSEPHPAVISVVTRLLDPGSNDCLKLEVVRRKDGKSPTKRVNDRFIAERVKEYTQAFGNRHGDQTRAVKRLANELEISAATVRKAIRSK
jgi:hypothetical protein